MRDRDNLSPSNADIRTRKSVIPLPQRIQAEVYDEQRVIWAVPLFWQLVTSLSLRRPGFDGKPVHVGVMMDKVTPKEYFLRVLRVSAINIILPVLPTHT
jgi:hypothetical protein